MSNISEKYSCPPLEDASEYLKKNYKHVVQEAPIKVSVDKLIDQIKKSGFQLISYTIDKRKYNFYLENADYDVNYPKYVMQFKEALVKKTIQHYISYDLLDMQSEKTYLDVASSASCFPDIAERLCNVKVLRQDIGYTWGINGDRIGSFASSIPLESQSIDYMGLHCSLEHFEGGEDFAFFKEAGRLLSSHGKCCIVPLYLSDEYTIMTSPEVWMTKYRVYNEAPKLDSRAVININNSIKQRQSKHYSISILKEELLDKFKETFNIKIYYIENFRDIKGTYPFVLILEKK